MPPYQILVKKSAHAPAQGLPKTNDLQKAIKDARSWLNENGLRAKSKAQVYDEYDQSLAFRAEIDARGEVVSELLEPPKKRRRPGG
jgi:hypothetical protein